jgi:hypothetical protein
MSNCPGECFPQEIMVNICHSFISSSSAAVGNASTCTTITTASLWVAVLFQSL